MMRARHTIQIYRAAEDWVSGTSIEDIAQKYNRTVSTIDSWKRSDAWKAAVAGRERQKRESPARIAKNEDLETIKVTVEKWVALGKPHATEFSERTGIRLSRIEKWMELPFWESMTLYAEHRAKIRQRVAEKSKRKVSRKFPMHLLKQAVFLSLAGWTLPQISRAVGRSVPTLRDWLETDAWDEQQELIMLDKLLMHLIDTGLSLDQMYHQFFPYSR